MAGREAIVAAILETAEEFNESLDVKIDVALGERAPLFGRHGALDSLGLVSFVTAVEQDLADKLEMEVTLADENAMSLRRSPFRNVGRLADHALSAHAGSE
jgi:acyl carrier protein